MSGRGAQVGVALVAGALFGFGLALSGMVDPARVRGFLDLFGTWNPALAFVLGGAVFVAAIAVTVMRRMMHPIFGATFYLPAATEIDARLLLGSGVFGIGWGLAGLCPGPALAALSSGLGTVAVFVVAMLIGMVGHDRLVPGARAGRSPGLQAIGPSDS